MHLIIKDLDEGFDLVFFNNGTKDHQLRLSKLKYRKEIELYCICGKQCNLLKDWSDMELNITYEPDKEKEESKENKSNFLD